MKTALRTSFRFIAGLVIAFTVMAFLRGQVGEPVAPGAAPAILQQRGLVSAVQFHALCNPPVGTIVAHAGNWTKELETATGWMTCDGRELESGKYLELANALGVPAGKFRLPDLCGRTVVGAGQSQREPGKLTKHELNASGGIEKCALTKTEMPRHKHGVTDGQHRHTLKFGYAFPDGDEGGGTPRFDAGFNITGGVESIEMSSSNISVNVAGGDEARKENEGDGQPHENMPPYWALYYIIKVSSNPLDP